jgi:hypothetical protein
MASGSTNYGYKKMSDLVAKGIDVRATVYGYPRDCGYVNDPNPVYGPCERLSINACRHW